MCCREGHFTDDGQSGWVIVDEESMRPVAEASEWVLFVARRRKVTSNNPRMFLGSVVLNWFAGRGLDWRDSHVGELPLVFQIRRRTHPNRPLPAALRQIGQRSDDRCRPIPQVLRNAWDWSPRDVVLGCPSPPGHAPRDFHEGESGQHRLIRARTFKAPKS